MDVFSAARQSATNVWRTITCNPIINVASAIKNARLAKTIMMTAPLVMNNIGLAIPLSGAFHAKIIARFVQTTSAAHPAIKIFS